MKWFTNFFAKQKISSSLLEKIIYHFKANTTLSEKDCTHIKSIPLVNLSKFQTVYKYKTCYFEMDVL